MRAPDGVCVYVFFWAGGGAGTYPSVYSVLGRCFAGLAGLNTTNGARPTHQRTRTRTRTRTRRAHLWLAGGIEVCELARGQEAPRVVERRVDAAVADGLGADVLGVIRRRQRQLLSHVLRWHAHAYAVRVCAGPAGAWGGREV
jgi:hypothetical protein